MRTGLCTVMTMVLLALLPPAWAANWFGEDEVIVAVIDTGILSSHQEFDYRGPSSDEDQIVAWWDFTDTLGPIRLPRDGQLWDERMRDPYDDSGHGTATAALAVGRNKAPASQVQHSFAPGAKLAVARVCTNRASGQCPGSIAAAIRWATESVGADVITISIGYRTPSPQLLASVHEAAQSARRGGVLVLVSNGNGFANVGGPSPSWATPHADSTEVLTVGASDLWGATVSTDPEVVAPYWEVKIASNVCDACYKTGTGTSFSAPYVAGAAAAAIRAAVLHGQDASPEHMERLLKFSARDTAMPPSFEGYGIVDAAQVPTMISHASAGTLPERPEPDVNAWHVDGVVGTLRDVWSNELDNGRVMYEPAPVEVRTAQLVLGKSASPGLAEVERFRVRLAAREVLTVSVSAAYEFFDLQMYVGDGPTFRGRDMVANAKYGDPRLVYRSPIDATYTVVVAGFAIFWSDLPFAITASTSSGAEGVLTWDGQGYYWATSSYTQV